jgi:hypothetical protein
MKQFVNADDQQRDDTAQQDPIVEAYVSLAWFDQPVTPADEVPPSPGDNEPNPDIMFRVTITKEDELAFEPVEPGSALGWQTARIKRLCNEAGAKVDFKDQPDVNGEPVMCIDPDAPPGSPFNP